MPSTPDSLSAPAAQGSPSLPSGYGRALARIRWDLPSDAIERESFRTIVRECAAIRDRLAPGEWRVARRLIHTTADPTTAESLTFRNDPVRAGMAALRKGAPIYCDSRMIRAGLSLPKLRRACPDYCEDRLLCRNLDPAVVAMARAQGRTRAICAVESAKNILAGAIVLIGNAPLALARIARFAIEEDIRPALVIGFPVGFVNVVESKELMSCAPVPQVVLTGRRGGSTLAVAALHAILESVFAEDGSETGFLDAKTARYADRRP